MSDYDEPFDDNSFDGGDFVEAVEGLEDDDEGEEESAEVSTTNRVAQLPITYKITGTD